MTNSQFALVSFTCFTLGVVACLLPPSAAAGPLDFRAQELPTRLTVGYAVQLIDMNGDQRRDIAIVDSKRILWLENPNWNEHVIYEDPSQPNDNVCFAPADIDGDGRLDFAVGADWQFNNTEAGGTIGWITPGENPLQPWTYHAIGQEPTVHRMHFADIDGSGRPELLVLPLKGRNTTAPAFDQSGVRLLAFKIPENPVQDTWSPRLITDELHVAHNFEPLREGAEAKLLIASFEGVTLLERDDTRWIAQRVGAGDQQPPPGRGASEVRSGSLDGGFDYIATIEPWHGNKVVVYTRPDAPRPATGPWLWQRHVLDDQLKWGHAIRCVNLDDDPAEELVIGVRDDLDEKSRRGLRIYAPQDAGGHSWKRHIVDPGSVAIEDLDVADLNGNGRADIVAVGRQTHNVKIYWNETR